MFTVVDEMTGPLGPGGRCSVHERWSYTWRPGQSMSCRTVAHLAASSVHERRITAMSARLTIDPADTPEAEWVARVRAFLDAAAEAGDVVDLVTRTETLTPAAQP